MKPRTGSLELGSNVVELLLPQRRPFLMVDAVEAFDAAVPSLTTRRHISANEPCFDGHFPQLHIWPGTLTLEGMAQSSALLLALVVMRRAAAAEGSAPDAVLEVLRNIDRGYKLHPGYRPAEAAALLDRLRREPPLLAVGASAEVKFLKPVFPGTCLTFHVALTDEFGDKVRCTAEATVAGEPVATAVLVGARLPTPRL